MKLETITFYLLLTIFTISCSKDGSDDCEDPIDCLPAMTQSGANTAGCLVDGSALTPGGQSLNSGSVLKAQYNFYQDSYLFGLVINDLRSHNKTISIEIRSQEIHEGETYKLQEYSEVTDSGFYRDEFLGGYRTTETVTGELFISKLDKTNRIAAGTFWFDAENNDGEIVEIRQGRFDVKYY